MNAIKSIIILPFLLSFFFSNAQICNEVKGNYYAEFDLESLNNSENVIKANISQQENSNDKEILEKIKKARAENKGVQPSNFNKEVNITDNSLSVKLSPKLSCNYKCKACKKISEERYLIVTSEDKELYLTKSEGKVLFDFEGLKLILTNI